MLDQTMGRIKWCTQEWLFLEELTEGRDDKELLSRNAHNWGKGAVCW